MSQPHPINLNPPPGLERDAYFAAFIQAPPFKTLRGAAALEEELERLRPRWPIGDKADRPDRLAQINRLERRLYDLERWHDKSP